MVHYLDWFRSRPTDPVPVDPQVIDHRIPGRHKRVFYHNVRWNDEYGWSFIRERTENELDAEVVSSEIVGSKLHAPVIDLDSPAYLIPSATPGHNHLYLDTTMSWRKYRRLLKALAASGVIEYGYMKACLRRKHSSVRVPWKKKGFDD